MTQVVTVEIGGQHYPIRSTLDERYVTELAAYVDRKMRAAFDAAPTSDMLGAAILVALNIADELFRARDQHSSSDGILHDRTVQLERLVDDVLARAAAAAPASRRLDHPRQPG